jgi:hypothetical protein
MKIFSLKAQLFMIAADMAARNTGMISALFKHRGRRD